MLLNLLQCKNIESKREWSADMLCNNEPAELCANDVIKVSQILSRAAISSIRRSVARGMETPQTGKFNSLECIGISVARSMEVF